MRSWFLIVALGCGRINFDPLGTGAGDGGGDPRDANRIFVSRMAIDAGFGGLAGADAHCAMSAASVGLTGEFRAWLSTSTVDAVDRFAGSRGWVLVDGTLVIDRIEDLAATGKMFAPIVLDERGIESVGAVWTGTLPNGRVNTGNTCNDWTNTGSTVIGNIDSGPPDYTDWIPALCNGSLARLYCLQVGNNVALSPPRAIDGRLAFLSSPRAAAGLGALDGICSADATAAGLPGTYRAAVATTTATIASRFTIDNRPWRRVDGTLVASGPAMFDGSKLLGFVTQNADGTYHGASTALLSDVAVFTGSINATTLGNPVTTCNDWSDVSASQTGGYGAPNHLLPTYFWYLGDLACSQGLPVLCFQD